VKLYFFPVAPNPTKVRLYLAEKAAAGGAIPLEEVVVSLIEGEQKEPAHLARNPFGTLPVLELEDGSHLHESLAIIEYLEERNPEPAMIGRDPEERARTRQLERIAETRVLNAMAQLVHATRSPLGLPARPEVAAEAEARLHDGLAYVEGLLADGRPFVAGERLTVADCTLAAGLQFGRFREYGLDPRYAHLTRWDRDFRGRPSAKSVLSL